MLYIIFLFASPPPYDPFRDPIWQFVGVIAAIVFGIVAVAALVLGILSYRKQKQHKEIACQIVSDAPIVSVNEVVKNRVKVFLDNMEINNPRLLVIKVRNSGNLSVKPQDYFEPIEFEFESGKVISSDILGTEPIDLIDRKTIKTFLKSETTFIELPLFPLNPGDSITFTVLLTTSSNFTLRGRIDQGKIVQIRDYSEGPQNETIYHTMKVVLIDVAKQMVSLFIPFRLR